MAELKKEGGWGWPGASRKAHYFNDAAISLCRKWMYTGPLTANQGGTSPDDCAVCARALAKLEPFISESDPVTTTPEASPVSTHPPHVWGSDGEAWYCPGSGVEADEQERLLRARQKMGLRP